MQNHVMAMHCCWCVQCIYACLYACRHCAGLYECMRVHGPTACVYVRNAIFGVGSELRNHIFWRIHFFIYTFFWLRPWQHVFFRGGYHFSMHLKLFAHAYSVGMECKLDWWKHSWIINVELIKWSLVKQKLDWWNVIATIPKLKLDW